MTGSAASVPAEVAGRRMLLTLIALVALAWGCAAAPAPRSLPSDARPSFGRPSDSPPSTPPAPAASATEPSATTEEPLQPSPSSVPFAPSAGPSVTPTPTADASVEPTSPAEPSPTAVARPLPECRYADRATRHTDQDEWHITLLDPIYRLPADYAPERLVSTSRAGLQSGYEVRPEVIDDLRVMAEASREADAEIAVRWAYRGYGEQAGAFAHWSRQAGHQRALRVSARPGHSEHQLGTALDFRSAESLRPPWGYDDWGRTPAGAWMAQNSWRYGFLLSYPRGLSDETCYDYEPWHFRYVGRELAAAVQESGRSLRRYLWENYERPSRVGSGVATSR